MPALKIISGPDAGRSIQLLPGAIVRLGRKPPPQEGTGPVIDLVVDDQKLSRLHCEIAPAEAWWVVRDCKSSNGTFLNGERIAEKTLCPGDMIQAGDVFIEFHGISPGAPTPGARPRAGAPAPTPAEKSPPRARPVRRRRSAKPSLSPVPLLLFLGVAGGIAAVVVLRSRDAEPQVAGVTRDRPEDSASSPPDGSQDLSGDALAGVAMKEPAGAPPLTAPAETVAAHVAAGEYRQAMAYLDGLPAGDLDPRPLRRKVLDAALADLRDRVEKADRKPGAGDRARAREDLLAFIQRAPAEIASDATAALERLDHAGREPLPVETRKEKPAAPTRVRGKAARDEFTVRVEALASRWQALSSGPPDPARLEALAVEIGNLAREARQRPGNEASRRSLKDLFVKVKSACLKLGGTSLFAAAKVAWQGNRVSLKYDFTSDAQLDDFEKLSNSTAIKRTGNMLFLKGECRLLRGDPFAGMIAVRGKVSGHDRGAPNVTVALFTGTKHRLRIEGQEPRSLFIYQGGTSGPDPRDFVALGIGYRAAVATYGGKPIEMVYVAGKLEPLPMPAHAVFFGVRGAPLHSDPRECTWASPLTESSGPLTFEIIAEGDDLAWKLNDKPLPGAVAAAAAERWEGGLERTGSINILTGPVGAQIAFLDVEGEVRSGWIEEQFRKQTLAAFREFDPE